MKNFDASYTSIILLLLMLVIGLCVFIAYLFLKLYQEGCKTDLSLAKLDKTKNKYRNALVQISAALEKGNEREIADSLEKAFQLLV